jgi:hypothetical protein
VAAGVRFTKAEREFILRAVDTCHTVKEEKLRESIVDKLEKSELVKGKGRAPGLALSEAFSGFSQELGTRVTYPPRTAGPLLGQMANRLRMLGLTRGDCVTVARVAGLKWKGQIKAETLIRHAENLLVEARNPTLETHPRTTAPEMVEMEDI